MSEIGKRVRIERIMDRDSRNTVIIPLDHGISVGPIQGLADLPEMVNKVAGAGPMLCCSRREWSDTATAATARM